VAVLLKLLPVVLVVIASVMHAGWNLLLKRCKDKHASAWLFLLISALVCSPMPLFAGGLSISALGLICAVLGSLMGALHFLLLGFGYQIGDLSHVYPLSRGLMPVLTLAWAVLLLGERPSLLGLSGIVLVGVGAYVLHVREATPRGLIRPLKELGSRPSQIAVALAFVLSVMALVDKVGVSLVELAIYVPLLYTLRPAFLTPYVLYAKRGIIKAEWRENKWALVVAGVACPLNYLMVLYAFRMAEVSYVTALRQLSVVFGVLMGWLLLGESYGRIRFLASILIFTGAFLIGMAM